MHLSSANQYAQMGNIKFFVGLWIIGLILTIAMMFLPGMVQTIGGIVVFVAFWSIFIHHYNVHEEYKKAHGLA